LQLYASIAHSKSSKQRVLQRVRRCIVTTSSYTVDEDFGTADAVFDCIGDAGDERFSLHDLTTPGDTPCLANSGSDARPLGFASKAAVLVMRR